jgi:hypothetical protein
VRFSNMANKASRTFAALAETLIRKRSGGQQQIVVQHIHITADKAAVAVNGQQGNVTGGIIENGQQPCEQRQIGHEQQLTHAQVAPLRRQKPEKRQALPVPSNAERALPHSRRGQSRRAKGRA